MKIEVLLYSILNAAKVELNDLILKTLKVCELCDIDCNE